MNTMEKRSRGRPRLHDTPGQVPGVQALDRAVSVLKLVADGDGLSLTEVAETASLPASTAYRMLSTLQSHQMVEFDESRQLWHMGVETFRMGSSFLRRRKLTERGRDVMRALQIKTEETANLAVADADGVVFVSQVETHQPIRAFFRPGTRGDYHSSGVGKAILAFADDERGRRVAAGGLPAYTPFTITNEDAFLDELAAIHERGWSIDNEERHMGMRCVAVPFFNEFAEPVGGISVSGPAVRVTPEREPELGPLVVDAAKELTDLIGGRWPD